MYQINLSFKQRFAYSGDPLALYLELRRRQRVRFGGVIATPERHVLSLSPELFVRVADGRATVRPMKGTVRRGVTPEEDDYLASWLSADEKSRAENLMIVDLMRNDLGRLAAPGEVRVTDLYTVETYRTLHQLTSGVEAHLRPETSLPALVRAIFPCGSVTGAPKIRAMQIIRQLEAEPRGVYTGAIGLIQPGGRMLFNVAIRTVTLNANGEGELGVGSGIVFDSDGRSEYEECLLKSRFLSEASATLSLLETFRWDRRCGYALLERHLARLAASAAYFSIAYDASEVRRLLLESSAGFTGETCRVRLLIDEDGTISLTAAPLSVLPPVLRFALSPRPASSRDPMRYHKTTQRTLYEAELARQTAETGCHEVLFVNEHGELTEGAWTNLFLRRGDRLLTPPARCGLLIGTFASGIDRHPT
ncbi:MAG: aminodeoxychorismate synthase component I, partial [Rhodospirillales bacterium]|nr:aminodeoxychorismate synthase component I [Rhodospirillales bacterium]